MRPQHLFYVEGEVYGADNQCIDDKHAWLLSGNRTSQRLRHSDLTLDQYQGIGQCIVRTDIVRPKDLSVILPYPVQADGHDRSRPKTERVYYQPTAVTLLGAYDTAAFKGRLETFLGSCYNSTSFMGQTAINGSVDRLWLPHNSEVINDVRQNTLSAAPCDAQLFSSFC